MKAKEIQVGGVYFAKVNRRIVPVLVDAIREVNSDYQGSRRYDVTNLTTKRRTTFRSAAKFRAGRTLSK